VDAVCFGRLADVAAQLEVEFSLNNGMIADGLGYGTDSDMVVELEVQFADVA